MERRQPGSEPSDPQDLASAASRACEATSIEDGHIAGAIREVRIEVAGNRAAMLTRRGIIAAKHESQADRQDLARQLARAKNGTTEKDDLFKRVRRCAETEKLLEERLQTEFLPQHGPAQLIGARCFLQTRLFRVAGKQCLRAEVAQVPLLPEVMYRGPELRQSDGLVFAVLLHMARDALLGAAISFHPRDVCLVIFGRYDGNARKQLLDHIQRLQSGVVVFRTFSVQLCLRFDFPKKGRWSVALDENIRQLFAANAHVWMDLQTRIALPDGLTTWVYGYVRCQSRLIPTRLDKLRELSGSAAGERAFMNCMRAALRELTAKEVVDGGWSMSDGVLRWMKGPKG